MERKDWKNLSLGRRRALFNWRKKYSPIGIELGASQLKLVQFCRQGMQVALHCHAIIPFPDDWDLEKGKDKQESLGRWLQKRMEEFDFIGRDVNLSINHPQVGLRTVVLPRLPSRELKKAVNWEAQKYIMGSNAEVVADYAFERERVVEGKDSLELLLVTAPRDAVYENLKIIEYAGLNLKSLEVEPLSLLRAANALVDENDSDDAGLVVVLDLGGESSSLLLIRDGEYAFSRIFKFSVNSFCRDLAANNDLAEEDVFKKLEGEGISELSGYGDMLDEVAEVINRSLEYYTRRFEEDLDIHKILVAGGGSRIEGLFSCLAEKAGMDVQLFSPFSSVWGEFNSAQFDETSVADISEAELSCLGVAAGLAIKGWWALEN